MEILELKNIFENSVDVLKSKIGKTDGRICELEEINNRITPSEQERK